MTPRHCLRTAERTVRDLPPDQPGEPEGRRSAWAWGRLGPAGSPGQGLRREREGAGSPEPGVRGRPSPRAGRTWPRPAMAGGVAVGTGPRHRDSGKSRGPADVPPRTGRGAVFKIIKQAYMFFWQYVCPSKYPAEIPSFQHHRVNTAKICFTNSELRQVISRQKFKHLGAITGFEETASIIYGGTGKDKFKKDNPLQAVLQPYKLNSRRFICVIPASTLLACLIGMQGAWFLSVHHSTAPTAYSLQWQVLNTSTNYTPPYQAPPETQLTTTCAK
ncbi:uncharacterized protein LOC108640165 [Manacus vitellinus]|uniref:uncharacterized protein LOC108640165 n=1 Tax=Manacus vitellinus TaxID=328815 RepID=UPI00084726EF|nr:uncharacterized protein LOC108640165 [Manacus vitellinus]